MEPSSLELSMRRRPTLTRSMCYRQKLQGAAAASLLNRPMPTNPNEHCLLQESMPRQLTASLASDVTCWPEADKRGASECPLVRGKADWGEIVRDFRF
jgi:hypothetical protein